MQLCYGDEAGCTGVLPAANSPIQPVLVIAGVCFAQAELHQITMDFLNLKQQFFPGSQLRRGNPPTLQPPPTLTLAFLSYLRSATATITWESRLPIFFARGCFSPLAPTRIARGR